MAGGAHACEAAGAQRQRCPGPGGAEEEEEEEEEGRGAGERPRPSLGGAAAGNEPLTRHTAPLLPAPRAGVPPRHPGARLRGAGGAELLCEPRCAWKEAV